MKSMADRNFWRTTIGALWWKDKCSAFWRCCSRPLLILLYPLTKMLLISTLSRLSDNICFTGFPLVLRHVAAIEDLKDFRWDQNWCSRDRTHHLHPTHHHHRCSKKYRPSKLTHTHHVRWRCVEGKTRLRGHESLYVCFWVRTYVSTYVRTLR